MSRLNYSRATSGVGWLRAGIVKQPEKYRWNSIGYHVQTGNQDHFLSTDFGLKEFNVRSEKERIRRYRRYLYEAGSLDRPDKGKIKGSRKIKFAFLRVKASAWQGAKVQEYQDISSFRNAARQDELALKSEIC